jgi:hypothetical protein
MDHTDVQALITIQLTFHLSFPLARSTGPRELPSPEVNPLVLNPKYLAPFSSLLPPPINTTSSTITTANRSAAVYAPDVRASHLHAPWEHKSEVLPKKRSDSDSDPSSEIPDEPTRAISRTFAGHRSSSKPQRHQRAVPSPSHRFSA